ncbi:hypothetical protein BDE36_0182 [Arcticibacter tournemirensis]|nr:hypothetical protein BDE36_0182 [Arcticibacter tournemirensis]
MKIRYYILIIFYVFCLSSFNIGMQIKDYLYHLSQFDTLTSSFSFIFEGFIQMIYLLLLLWLAVASGTYAFVKKRMARGDTSNTIMKEWLLGAKLSLLSVLALFIIVSLIMFLEL